MKRFNRNYLFAAVLGAVVCIVTIGAVTMNYGKPFPVKMVTVTLTSDASGDDTEAVTFVQDPTAGTTSQISGFINRFTTIPASGSSSPTANWDVTLVDASAVDLLQAGGANRSQSSTESVVLANPSACVGPLQVRASNMGNTKSATFIFYISP